MQYLYPGRAPIILDKEETKKVQSFLEEMKNLSLDELEEELEEPLERDMKHKGVWPPKDNLWFEKKGDEWELTEGGKPYVIAAVLGMQGPSVTAPAQPLINQNTIEEELPSFSGKGMKILKPEGALGRISERVNSAFERMGLRKPTNEPVEREESGELVSKGMGGAKSGADSALAYVGRQGNQLTNRRFHEDPEKFLEQTERGFKSGKSAEFGEKNIKGDLTYDKGRIGVGITQKWKLADWLICRSDARCMSENSVKDLVKGEELNLRYSMAVGLDAAISKGWGTGFQLDTSRIFGQNDFEDRHNIQAVRFNFGFTYAMAKGAVFSIFGGPDNIENRSEGHSVVVGFSTGK